MEGQAVKDTIDKLHEDFPNTPEGRAMRWATEFQASDKAHKDFYKQGDKVVSKYLNDAKAGDAEDRKRFKLNFFHANIDTVQAMMFGKLPKVSFSRANYDPDDDVARVAGMILERMLNNDIGTPDDDYSATLRANLQDRLLPGLGIARVRYEFEEETQEIEEVRDMEGNVVYEASTYTEVTDEFAPIDYVHWRDFKWQPCRRWREMGWMAFRSFPTYDDLVDRFDEEIADQIPLDAVPYNKEQHSDTGTEAITDATKRAELWEIWDKDAGEVIWYCPKYPKTLDVKDDPLELRGFFPTPEPLVSNVTTSAFVPLADYILAQDLYNEIDELERRICGLTQAVKAIGVYNNAFPEISKMFNEANDTELIAVDQWESFAEKNGLRGAIDWVPIQDIANVINELVKRRNDATGMLFQITGLSDIMRGAQAAGGAVTATERALEARFASVKIQALQDDFARYATELIRLRAEVVSRHFDAETIVRHSNIDQTADAQYIPQAIALIKDTQDLVYRVEVKPESVAMVDYAQLKTERTEYITALATFMQSAAPLVQFEPESAPVLMSLLQWGMAGFKGSQDVEGILDQAINQIKNRQQQAQGQKQPPSPEQIKAESEREKRQFEMQKLQVQAQLEQQKMQHERFMARFEAQKSTENIVLESERELSQEAAQAALNMEERTHEANESIREARGVAGAQRREGGDV